MSTFESAIQAGTAAEEAGQLEEALAHFGRALQHKPGDAQTHMFRVAVLNKLDRKEEALAECNEVLLSDPSQAPALWCRATVLRELAKYEDALADIDEAIRLQDMTLYRLERAQILAVKGDHADAETQLADVIRRSLAESNIQMMVMATQTLISIYRANGLHEKADAMEKKLHQLASGEGGGKSSSGRGCCGLLFIFLLIFLWKTFGGG